jgi:hypothetical protein
MILTASSTLLFIPFSLTKKMLTLNRRLLQNLTTSQDEIPTPNSTDKPKVGRIGSYGAYQTKLSNFRPT